MAERLCALPECSEPIGSGPASKRYCCEPHRRRAERRRYQAKPVAIRRCPHCGETFDARRGQTYCTLACQYAHRSATYLERDDIGTYERVGVMAYCQAVRLDPCAYCGKRGDTDIDHIVPRSEGGPNHWENYTAACRSCNSSKRTRSVLGFLGWRQAARHFDSWVIFNGGAALAKHRNLAARRAAHTPGDPPLAA
jgi:5-methylcytosine-specific restriction endonuclease McrA